MTSWIASWASEAPDLLHVDGPGLARALDGSLSRWLGPRRAFASVGLLADLRGQASTFLAHLGEGRLRPPAMPLGRLRASPLRCEPEHDEDVQGEEDRRDDATTAIDATFILVNLHVFWGRNVDPGIP